MDKKSLKQYYEQKAQNLDEYHITYNHPSLYKRFFFKTRLKNVLSLLNARKNEVILDIGCGSGVYTKELIKKGSKVTAIDIAETYLSQTKKLVGRTKRLQLVAADATKLPFKRNTFDKVLFTEVIEHIPQYEKSLREIHRVIKPNGTVTISTPSRFSPLNIAYEIKRKINRYSYNEHIHEFTPGEFLRLIQKYFVVEKFVFTNFFFPYPFDQIAIHISSKRFIKILTKAEQFMQNHPLLKYFGWTMIIRVKKI